MDEECYEMGSCKICGCETTALQMCSKSCNKPCYPPMMNKKQWKKFKTGSTVIIDDQNCWYKLIDGQPMRMPNSSKLKNKERDYVLGDS